MLGLIFGKGVVLFGSSPSQAPRKAVGQGQVLKLLERGGFIGEEAAAWPAAALPPVALEKDAPNWGCSWGCSPDVLS